MFETAQINFSGDVCAAVAIAVVIAQAPHLPPM